ncbi:hypothetical protein CEXT_231581 [Caerostris extrusa]|uniref:Uncharacterized protein n=1 Tax=Caerostris extrusa TaxID=172846 RepID=A0AAV4XMH0_CAEEX|nr:hypothetical protein CEXT_231581 [Caerostris extrusa]
MKRKRRSQAAGVPAFDEDRFCVYKDVTHRRKLSLEIKRLFILAQKRPPTRKRNCNFISSLGLLTRTERASRVDKIVEKLGEELSSERTRFLKQKLLRNKDL